MNKDEAYDQKVKDNYEKCENCLIGTCHYVPSSLPFGVMQCSVEPRPKILYANRAMLDILGVKDVGSDWWGDLKENVLFMVPLENRDSFRGFLKEAEETGTPVSLHHNVYCSDGSKTEVAGWMIMAENAGGVKEFSFVYMHITSTHLTRRYHRENSYFKALQSAYNVIFEINLSNKTVDCVYGKDTSPIGCIYDVCMSVENAMSYWLENYIVPDDRAMMKEYFMQITNPGIIKEAQRPLQADFAIRVVSSGEYHSYLGVAVELDANIVLFCCRDTTQVKYTRFAGVTESVPHIFIRTFGYFDIFVDGKAVTFSNRKSKELLALLVDRNGGAVTSDEATGILWEDATDTNARARYRKVAMNLNRTLEQYGIGDIIINSHGTRSLDIAKVECDYFGLLKGDAKYRSKFSDAYMSNYSWAEETLASLLIMTEEHK